jgi:NAD-dependent SIR2 family protein deacetylase
MSSDLFSKAAEFIQQADGVLITAGAGMGVDSGLPDFRGKEGLWKAYPALAQANLSFSEIACRSISEIVAATLARVSV